MSQTFCVHYYVVIIFLVFLLFVCSLIVLRKMTKIGVDFLSTQWKWKYSEELCSCAKSQQLKKDYAPSLIKEHLQKKHHISGNHWCVPPMHPLRITQFSDYLFLCYLSWFVKTPNTWWTRKNAQISINIYCTVFLRWMYILFAIIFPDFEMVVSQYIWIWHFRGNFSVLSYIKLAPK